VGRADDMRFCPFAFLPFAGTNVDVKMKDPLHCCRSPALGWLQLGGNALGWTALAPASS
jgi:hypothetical protein